MKIIKKRINKLENNFPSKIWGTNIIPAVILDIDKDQSLIKKIGFSDNMNVGESVLPMSFGSVTKFNSEGRELPDKTKLMETKYREIEWCWNQWAGRGKTKRVCDNRLVPYERYQRIFINPPSVELKISKKENGKIYITTGHIIVSEKNKKPVIHVINLLLEIFNFCDILDGQQIPIVATTKTLNWTILPSGKKPWEDQKKLVQPVLDLIKDKRVRPVVAARFEDINNFSPEFTAIGNQGFSGYIVFGFPQKNIYILESAFYGNAIYVFNEKWEEISKKTKADIITNKLQIDRITHGGERVNWLDKLKELLK